MPNKKVKLRLADNTGNALDSLESAELFAPCSVAFNNQAAPYSVPRLTMRENWDHLPVITTIVATSSKFFLVTGTNAASNLCTRATKGGVRVATGGSTNDSTVLNAQTTCSGVVPLSATNRVSFRTQLSLGSISPAYVARFGLAQAASTTDPSAVAGTDSAQFVFDPTNVMTTGLTAAVYEANWLIVTKAASGTATFADTGWAVAADHEYELLIQFGTDLKPSYYINGTLVGAGATALGSSTVVPTLGIKGLADFTGVFNCRYVDVGRLIS